MSFPTFGGGLILSVIFLAGCGPLDTTPKPIVPKVEPPVYNIPNTRTVRRNDYLDCPNGTYLTYENFGESFFLNNCTGCHSAALVNPNDEEDTSLRGGAPSLVNLDTPEDIQMFRYQILRTTRAKFQSYTDDEQIEDDADGDGIPDREEDSDGDGIPDINEDENQNGIPDISENPAEPVEVEDENAFSLMPPSGALDIPTLRLLREYLECGAPSGRDKIQN